MKQSQINMKILETINSKAFRGEYGQRVERSLFSKNNRDEDFDGKVFRSRLQLAGPAKDVDGQEMKWEK